MGDSSDKALSIWLEQAPLAELIDAAAVCATRGMGASFLFAQSVHSADPSLPGRLPLLHLRRAATRGTVRLSFPGRSARDRPRRRGGRLHGGALHAGRQAGAALPRRARGAGGAGTRNDHRLSSGDVRARVARDRTAAARQSRRDEPIRDRRLAEVSASQGIMLESLSERLCEPGGVHYGSPDKRPGRGWRRCGWPANCACRSRPAF